jgi:ABC-type nitrate/sulfonate/bicarbonate transport system permease component
MKRFLWFILPIFCVLILWEIVSRSSFVSPTLFPPPSKVIIALWGMIMTGTLLTDLRDSLWRLSAGLFIGSIVGIVVGLLTGRIKSFATAFTPIIQILRPLPPVAIIPLVIIWFGIDNGAKIFSIAFAVFFPVWINTHIGVRQIPQVFLWNAKLLTKSLTKTVTKVLFPATLPFMVAGIRTGIAVAFIMVFVSELTGASSGLGYRISVAHLSYRIDEMMAGLVILGVVGAMADRFFVFGVERFFPWINFSSK